jgi:hypothetical protein
LKEKNLKIARTADSMVQVQKLAAKQQSKLIVRVPTISEAINGLQNAAVRAD